MLQCLAVEVRKGSGRSARTVPYVIRFIPGHPTQVRDGRRALCRGAAFDLWCRSCQGCDLLLRQEAFASAVNPRGSQLPYSSLEFNFALQRANDLSQLAQYQLPQKLLCCKASVRAAHRARQPLTSSHRRFAELGCRGSHASRSSLQGAGGSRAQSRCGRRSRAAPGAGCNLRRRTTHAR